jgi:hypothetical protein
MPFRVSAHIDDHVLILNAKSAKEPFAEAVDWHVKRLAGVTISDGIKSFGAGVC